MPRLIRIRFSEHSWDAELNESATALAIWDRLPLRGQGNRWGQEIYFPIPVSVGEEDAREVLEPGALAYWPEGNALCIFWGPTPVSRGGECRAYSPVNLVGKIAGDLSPLDGWRDLTVSVEKRAQ